MSIKHITTDELRKMDDQEGLILQGCGGDLNEWVEGINELLTAEGILLKGTKFQNCASFTHDGVTCLLYPFEGVELDIGKFAIWRLQYYQAYGGTWLSDYVPNRLGGFVGQRKPDCPLVGEDGNIFNLMGIAARTLRQNDMAKEAAVMCSRIYEAGSYEEALCIIGEYVNITSTEDQETGLTMQ